MANIDFQFAKRNCFIPCLVESFYYIKQDEQDDKKEIQIYNTEFTQGFDHTVPIFILYNYEVFLLERTSNYVI